ncbi:MAG: bifunctional DNA-formamidopyrimidine glycosylase/DNA-(apurinic or apyrimidinic site) lyase [Patescibacteria group bacterium]
MPELPEIETVKLQLGGVLVGQKLTKITLNNNRTVKGDIQHLVGKRVVGVNRKGKVLLIDFGDGTELGFHFKMTGQLIYDDGKTRISGGHPTEDFVNKMPSSHTRVIFEFENSKLYFNDQRLFGWIEVNPKFVDKLGPEPFEISKDEFIKRLSKLRSPIKTVIMNQEVISGVGNIYANDALWEAGINPRVISYQLSVEQLSLLLEKIILVLNEGIKYGGATYDDYLDLHGAGGHYQEHFRTYKQDGKACKRCGETIVKNVLGGRGTYYCPNCQK